MKYSIDTLNAIKEQATTEANHYAEAISATNDHASDGTITWTDAERINAASKSCMDKANAIVSAASHALSNAISATRPRLPFAPAPAPLTAEEENILAQAFAIYFGA